MSTSSASVSFAEFARRARQRASASSSSLTSTSTPASSTPTPNPTLAKGAIYVFDDEDRRLIEKVVACRVQAVIDSHPGMQIDVADNIEKHTRGVEGELAMYRMLHIEDLSLLIDTKANDALIDKGDLVLPNGSSLDVKTSVSPHGPLLVQPWKLQNPAKWYALLRPVASDGSHWRGSAAGERAEGYVFVGAIHSRDVFNPLFSPFTRDIPPKSSLSSRHVLPMVCYQVPECFLGSFPIPRLDCDLRAPRSGSEMMELLAEHPELRKTHFKHITDDALRLLARQMDDGIQDPVMTMAQWRQRCMEGSKPRWA